MGPCPRCKHDRSVVRYDFGREKIVRCAACSLLYLDPWPKVEDLEAVYGDSYFENQEFLRGENESLFGYADYIAERFNKQPQNADIARDLHALLPPLSHPPRLLEVGCGFGYFLSEAFEEGFEVSGVEFNRSAVERLRRKHSFPVLVGALEDLDLPAHAFDCVAMFDVIEHLRDPFTCLDKLYESLAPGGVLAVSTMDAESWVSRLIGKRLEDFRRTREHLYFFGRETLTDVLEEHGFDVLEIRSIGHTFELSFLLERLALYNRPIFKAARWLCDTLGLGSLRIRVNPRTKMIVLARKRGARMASPRKAESEVDRTLIDELQTLERSTPRHYQWVFDLIEPYIGRSVLEVASGTGVISKFLVPRTESLILSDYQPVYLDLLRQRFGALDHVDYRILDLTQTPYDTGGRSIDTIVCLNTLEHIEHDDAVLRGFNELLPKGGRLVLQVPNYPALFGSLDESYGHYRRYHKREVQTLLERAGFDVQLLRKHNPFSIPGWILSGQILRSRRLNAGSLRFYDSLVPILRRLDFLSHAAGLSLIAVAEKH